jgi:5-(carboxyamino)imidazole ribonucleotide synthase
MRNHHLAIIGGGQLGMLLTQAAMAYPAHVSVYDPNPYCSASFFTSNFEQGEFSDQDQIVNFAREADAVIFETESVSTQALEQLEKMGKRLLSRPKDLRWIKNKASQRTKLKESGFKVPEFQILKADQIPDYSGPFPVVQKWQSGGYDGLGVEIFENQEIFRKQAQKIDSVLETKIDLAKEVSVIVARSDKGELASYPPVEMVFDPEANLVDYLIAPGQISREQSAKLTALAEELATKFDFYGVYVIEFFISQDQEIYVNEISPRVHNSGHHTIAANASSQYDQQIRLALGLPLGSVKQISPCVMLNLLAGDCSGNTAYLGLNEAYQIPNVQYVFYGKDTVRPKRKMGHALILEHDLEKAQAKIEQIRNTLTITNHE